MICIGALFVILNVFNIYGNTFGDFSNGVVLLKYTVGKNTYTIMKREVKRSIYIQIIIFSAHSVYIMCVDKSMELMLFATGNVYKRDVASLLRCNNEGTRKRIKWAQCFTLIFFTLSALSFSITLFINGQCFLHSYRFFWGAIIGIVQRFLLRKRVDKYGKAIVERAYCDYRACACILQFCY